MPEAPCGVRAAIKAQPATWAAWAVEVISLLSSQSNLYTPNSDSWWECGATWLAALPTPMQGWVRWASWSWFLSTYDWELPPHLADLLMSAGLPLI